MNKSTAYTTSILATSIAAAIAYALVPAPSRLKRGQVALITGGSRGLGLALAHRFGRAGLKLVLSARSADELDVARDSLLRAQSVLNEDDILLVEADLTDKNQCAGLVENADRTFGQLDVLINNAGIIEVGPFENQSAQAFEQAMQTNFFAALHTIQAALPLMLERGSGAIVNIASIGGKIPVPHMLPYVASKFALTGFSEGLHAEVRQKGVRVTTVCPGLMRTGGEVHAHFTGQVDQEKAWFQASAQNPILAASLKHASHVIFNAVNAGRAEVTITPQAWLAARFFGLAPETSQILASIANEYILPDPTGSPVLVPKPDQSPAHTHETEPFADPSPS